MQSRDQLEEVTMLEGLPRVRLGHFPTPIEELGNLSALLGGPRLVVKRDDLTGLAGGGNKTRKLEFLIADALQQGAQTVITAGAAQSNHARQTAAAAARYGLGCVLVLSGRAPSRVSGNLLLDRLLGARIRWTGDRVASLVMEEVAAEERSAGRAPYVIPYGGSNAVGAAGYVLAMDELLRQALDSDLLGRKMAIDHIVCASGSAGTQAGLVVGAQAVHYGGSVLGISVGPHAAELQRHILELAHLTVEHVGLRVEIGTEQVRVLDDYTGGGYGVLGAAEREAVLLLARTEGLLLDPVYTGRAMAALLDLVRKGQFSRRETVLFWHTGGTTALDAYGDGLLAQGDTPGLQAPAAPERAQRGR